MAEREGKNSNPKDLINSRELFNTLAKCNDYLEENCPDVYDDKSSRPEP